MANSVKIEIDDKSFQNVQKQLESLKIGGITSAYRALMKVAFKIKSEAQLRLTGRGHINTSRLKNSLFVQAKNISDVTRRNNALTYSDKKGNTYSSELTTVSLGENEFAVGTNVEYAAAVEMGSKSHVIVPMAGNVLSWMPQAKGKAWFTTKNKSSLKTYYSDREGNNTLKRNRVFAKRVNHPGFAGDSFLYWALKNVNVQQSVAKDMQDDIKFGKFLKPQSIYEVKGKALTNND